MKRISILLALLCNAIVGFAQNNWQFSIKKVSSNSFEILGKPNYTNSLNKINTLGVAFGIPVASYPAGTPPTPVYTPSSTTFDATYASNNLVTNVTDVPGHRVWAIYINSFAPPTFPITSGTVYSFGVVAFKNVPNSSAVVSLFDDPSGNGGSSGNLGSFIATSTGFNYNNLTTSALYYQTTGTNGSNTPTTTGLPLNYNQLSLSNTVALPLQLLAFNAEKAGQTRSRLNWVTASEENTSYFEVERSLTGDASSYRSLGTKVPAAGNSSSNLNYQAFDESPATGNNYYRLKMVDINGEVSYSSTRIVNFGSRAYTESVSLFPNPIRVEGAEVKLRVDVATAQTLDYSLTDVTGKLIYTGKTEVNAGIASYGIEGFSSIAPGSYFLRVKGTTLSDNIKVLKTD